LPVNLNDGPTNAVDTAHTSAASRARQAVRDLETLLDQAGITDQMQREQAHAAFALAFPISYRLWSSRLNQAANQSDR